MLPKILKKPVQILIVTNYTFVKFLIEFGMLVSSFPVILISSESIGMGILYQLSYQNLNINKIVQDIQHKVPFIICIVLYYSHLQSKIIVDYSNRAVFDCRKIFIVK